jgi:hypothetical protein
VQRGEQWGDGFGQSCHSSIKVGNTNGFKQEENLGTYTANIYSF